MICAPHPGLDPVPGLSQAQPFSIVNVDYFGCLYAPRGGRLYRPQLPTAYPILGPDCPRSGGVTHGAK